MASELEGLIAGLLLRISLEGEQGCSVPDLIGAIESSSGKDQNVNTSNQAEEAPNHLATEPSRRTCTIWNWLAARRDVSIGLDRAYNHLTLNDLLARIRAAEPRHVEASSSASESDAIHVKASEETMWESLTGHAVDYKRVPKSEWMLLQGIASTMSGGILQGDLGRLVDQDKRSVPKRTDSLLKKGYIVKRTTLVRGTKTSKMWLKGFAPSLPKDGGDGVDEVSGPAMTMTRQLLADNLDPVPWHIRWTGESVDYIALATTIMAVAKEWGVLRMLHLKSKLGILSMRWQMKVLAKTCRFLNARGVIQYVAAKLGDKVYKDCIKFVRDLSPEDWSLFLATGKRHKRPAAITGSADDLDVIDPLLLQSANTSELTSAPPWSVDKPLPASIVEIAHRFGDAGMTNPDVYGLTLGSTFSRFLSTLTATIATPNLQPPRLTHLQLRSEHTRVGKVASYRYFPQKLPGASEAVATEPSIEWKEGDYSTYGFTSLSSSMMTSTNSAALVGPSQAGPARRGVRGRPRGPRKPKEAPPDDNAKEASVEVVEGEGGQKETTEQNQDEPQEVPQKASAEESVDQTIVSRPARPRRTRKAVTRTTAPDSDTATADPTEGRRRRGGDSENRPWKCEKCGNSWKNDIGLKYHLEKSRTTCNPSFNELELTPRVGRKRARPETTVSSKEQTGTPVADRADRPSEPKASPKQENDEPGTEDVAEPGPEIVVLVDDTEEAPPELRPSTTSAESLVQTAPELQNPPVDTAQEPQPPSTTRGALLESERSRTQPLPTISDRLQPEPTPEVGGAERTSQLEIITIPSNATSPHASATPILIEATPLVSPTVPGGSGQPARALEEVGGDRGREESLDRLPADRQFSRSTPEPIREISGPEPAKIIPEIPLANGLTRSALVRRVADIILNLLDEHDGVFPGGKSLWCAVNTVWGEKFPDDSLPDIKICRAGLRSLLNQKSCAEHWHGFRDEKGMFSKCQIIIAPSVFPFSPEAVALLGRVKEAFPQMYLPPPFVAPSIKDRRGRRALPNDVETLDAPVYVAPVVKERRSRRPLPSEVETLDAPVYVAQASKRGADDEEDSAPQPKRPRGRPPGRTNQSSQNRQPEAGWIAGSHKEELEGRPWHDVFGAGSLQQPSEAIQFLEPNTFLDEEEPPGFPSRPISGSTVELSGESRPSKRRRLEGTFEDKVVGNALCIEGVNGTWPHLTPEYFEDRDCSFTIVGWMPDATWFSWESVMAEIDKRMVEYGGRRRQTRKTGRGERQRFVSSLVACMDLEKAWAGAFTSATPQAAGPHNIFVRFLGGEEEEAPIPSTITWPEDQQLTVQSFQVSEEGGEDVALVWDEELDLFDWDGVEDRRPGAKKAQARPAERPPQPETTQPLRPKRVALVTRDLTSFPEQPETPAETVVDIDAVGEPDRLLAAFVAVRVLLGGSEKAIDWALLLRIFPDLGLNTLRRFWLNARKEQRTLIDELTKDFQDRFIDAYEKDELPEFDYEDPMEYDWPDLIEWTVQLARKDGIQLPSTRDLLDDRYSTQDARRVEDDWQEKFFHIQASVFARFEWATARPAAIAVEDLSKNQLGSHVSDLDIAISWVRSLCCTSEARQSVQKIKEKFSTLPDPELLRTAIDQLTRQRVVCKSRKPLFGGRPYRLNEYFTYMVDKLGQIPKYREAAIFKTKLDALFRNGEKYKVPFTLDDGSVMALTNLNASGRVRIIPVDVPYIPFGFEPGNYESRKFPKSYYEFGMEIVPTATYLYNEDIEVLQLTLREGPPFGSFRGELPQWVDFFGTRIPRRWMSVLGAFCFHYATRGFLTVEGICTALRPVLEEFEARIIIDWGLRTGVLKKAKDGFGTMVGEWWWLAVPWQAKWSREQ